MRTAAEPPVLPAPAPTRANPWVPLSTAAALLVAAGSVVGLSWPTPIYGQETPALADSATAQDVVDLVVLVPLLLVLGQLAGRDRLRANLVWLGCLAFAVYNYAIYAFSIHFGPLFLVWTSVLGLATFALLGGWAATDPMTVTARFAGRWLRGPAWFLVGVAVVFIVLWVSEIVPDLWAGSASRSAAALQVPTNPVHVLDLAVFLPATLATGVLLLRRHPWGYTAVAGQLTWVALTCLPILVTPFVAQARGHEPGWSIMAPIGVILLASSVALARVLRAADPAAAPPER